MAFNYSPKIVTDGLVLYLDAANPKSYPGSGTVWRDMTGSNNGTLINGPTFDSGNGGSIVFDGVNDYVNVPSFVSNSQNMTFSLWFNPNLSLQGGKNIIYFQATSGYTLRLYKNSGHPTNFLAWLIYYERTNLTPGAILPLYEYPLNTWTNTTLSIDETGVYKVYINGSLWNTSGPFATFVQWLLPSGYLRLNNILGPFNGDISIFNIYNRTLTDQEILQNYNATKTRYQ